MGVVVPPVGVGVRVRVTVGVRVRVACGVAVKVGVIESVGVIVFVAPAVPAGIAVLGAVVAFGAITTVLVGVAAAVPVGHWPLVPAMISPCCWCAATCCGLTERAWNGFAGFPVGLHIQTSTPPS